MELFKVALIRGVNKTLGTATRFCDIVRSCFLARVRPITESIERSDIHPEWPSNLVCHHFLQIPLFLTVSVLDYTAATITTFTLSSTAG